MEDTTIATSAAVEVARRVLGKRNLVLVGLMGAGKSAIGKLVASEMGIPFIDSDHEIERVSRMTVPELFEKYGEPEFRRLENRVIVRLLRSGPRVLSTGGGAFMNEDTRRSIKASGVSLWLDADLETLWERVLKRDNRPLLKTENPKQTLENLMAARYPTYALADLRVKSRNEKKDVIAAEVIAAVAGMADGSGHE
jgi:shikimate kinase